jgi:nickel-dependent lactate racemase
MNLSIGSARESITEKDLAFHLDEWMGGLRGAPKRVLLVPPDHTRLHSFAGRIAAILYERLSPASEVHVLPALGTHHPMTETQLRLMFGEGIPLDAFRVHDWRDGVSRRGEIEPEYLDVLSGGRFAVPVEAEFDRLLFDGYDLIVSIGQVVPHEVSGMANYTKNLVVGTGGSDVINKSHFLGAVCGIESILGTTDNPVRALLNEAATRFLKDLPVEYLLTVVEDDEAGPVLRGLYSGGEAAFRSACALSQRLNITALEERPARMVVYLDPREFGSTWLGNKAVYRTRTAIADGGELIVLAPALERFGEDAGVDRLIRRYGYRGTEAVLEAVERDEELRANYGAAAHLIHGSTEGRFRVVYCPGEGLSCDAVRAVGFEAMPYADAIARYNPEALREGPNALPGGEEVYFIRNPALGLWKAKPKERENL